MTDKAITVIRRIGDWYLMEHGTYIRIYGAMKPPHLLPQFIPENIVLQEVAYQTIIHGVRGMLYRSKKEIWPPLPLYIGNYFFENTKQAQVEVDILLSYHFGEERFRRHDPKNIVKENFHRMRLPYEYTTEFWEEEEVHQNDKTYDEVIFNRWGQPKGRITDEEAAREETRKDAERDEAERSSPISVSTHSGSTEEDEEAPTDKKRRDKEKVLKRRNDAKKKQKLEADKAKARVENEAKEKVRKKPK
jgi:hypothetical protein